MSSPKARQNGNAPVADMGTPDPPAPAPAPATSHFLLDTHPERFIDELALNNNGMARDWSKFGLELPGWLIKREESPLEYEAATSSLGTIPGFAYDVIGRPTDTDRPEWLVELTMALRKPEATVPDRPVLEYPALFQRLVMGTQFVSNIVSNFLDQLAWDEKKLLRNTIITNKKRESLFRQALTMEQTEATMLEEIHRRKVPHNTVADRITWLAQAHKARLLAESTHREADAMNLRIREMRTTSRRLRKMVEDAREHYDAVQADIDELVKNVKEYLRGYNTMSKDSYPNLVPIIIEGWHKIEAEIDQTWKDAAEDYAFLLQNSREEEALREKVLKGEEVMEPPSTIPYDMESTNETPAGKTPIGKTTLSTASTTKTPNGTASSSKASTSKTTNGSVSSSKTANGIVSSSKASTSKASTTTTLSGVDPTTTNPPELPKYEIPRAEPESGDAPQSRAEPPSFKPIKYEPSSTKTPSPKPQSAKPAKDYSPHSAPENCQYSPL
ncbi:hypothetical protein B0T19DRAFT_464920 [Cercophora scortea]|uniref:Uncharacterized protein n=1 Tax=Cercophora scortea TaxID=314031 RepID=A0AAE0M9U5_9PEZI|nr:hypothetical protein B0T19DRAFT_464920 [Cercophora scortea]